jgi:3-mercaptopyruvate sulfurtransferase SseA
LAGGLNAWREHDYPMELREVPEAITAMMGDNRQ